MTRLVSSRIQRSAWLLALCSPALFAGDRFQPIIPNLPSVPQLSVSTVPPNGDVNPYGVAFVPFGFREDGSLHPGDVLVSNFNNGNNLQGTGTTIVRIAPDGTHSVFFQGPSGLGLTTALGVLRKGFVLVGNVPTSDGTCPSVQQGSLLVIDRFGNQVAAFTDPVLLDGPWDLTLVDLGHHAVVFVSNVLNGTVSRLVLKVSDEHSGGAPVSLESATQIASGYTHRCDPAALVVGPTGLAFDFVTDQLFVASTGDNTIFAIPHPFKANNSSGTGTVVYQDNVHLHGPLALVRAPNGDLITSNGDAVNPDPNQPSELVEFTRHGTFVAQRPVNSTGQGAAFGIAIAHSRDGIRFAAVDDLLNALDVWTIPR